MTPKELVSLAKTRGLLPDNWSGKTPYQTMKSKLSVDIKTKGEQSRFVRTAPGRFYLRKLLEGDEYQAVPIAPPLSAESVIVFPSSLLDDLDRFQGISDSGSSYLNLLRESGLLTSIPRLTAEMSDNYKQVLCYIMVTNGSRILAYRRGTYNRAEDFLKGCECIGFGGHVTAADTNLFTEPPPSIFQSCFRELQEELKLPELDRRRLEALEGLELVGVLNDDSSDVGRRHFAFLFVYTVSSDPAWNNPRRQEKSITQLRWLDTNSSDLKLLSFEYWSQLCLLHFFPNMVPTKASFTVIQRRVKKLLPPNPICIVGPVGSGKTEATSLLVKEFGYSEINSGRLIASILGIPKVTEKNRVHFQEQALAFIASSDGPKTLAKRIAEELTRQNNPRVLIDGIRQKSTFVELESLLGKRPGIVYVHTPPNIAFEFYKSRAGANTTIHQFLRVREQPVEQETFEFLPKADGVLYNWVGHDGYKDAVRDMMAKVLE